MEVTKEMLEEANRYWEAARKKVLRAAAEMGTEVENRKNFDGFMFDLFDNGEAEPTDDEIKTAIEEFLTY